MIRQLIGSSNVYRVYKHLDFTEYKEYEMVKCTNKEVFAVALNSIGTGKGEVIISVIENLLCDAVNGITDPETKNNTLETTIKEYLEAVREAAYKNPEVKFALVQPTLRPLHNWFTEGHEAFCKKITEGIRIMDIASVGKIESPIKMSQVFEQDGVHLTRSSGKVFVNAILYNAESFFKTEVVDLDEEMEGPQNVDKTAKKGTSKQATNTELKIEIENLKDDIARRRIDDSLVTARIREELDFLSNTRKEDRIIVTGLTSQIPMPVGFEEKKKWLRDLVGNILNQVETGSSDHMLNLIQGWKGSANIPLAEVRMDSVELAVKIRKQFAAKKKSGHDFGRVYLANSVTLGTRVRIEIMRVMAKCCANDNEIMHVSAFSSRPMLHVRPKKTGGRSMAFTFGDAITRYGIQMRQGELGEAYRRAGVAFKGQMQQNFVVLHDSRPPNVTPWIRKNAGDGAKRKLVGEGSGTGTPEKRKK